MSTADPWPLFCQAAAAYRQGDKNGVHDNHLQPMGNCPRDSGAEVQPVDDEPSMQAGGAPIAQPSEPRPVETLCLASPSTAPQQGRHFRAVPVSSSLLRVVDSISAGSQVRAREAGGGGDCLFHSFAAALKFMSESPAAVAHMEAVAPAVDLDKGGMEAVLQLRDLVAVEMLQWSDEDFLDFLILAASRESAQIWPDAWSPSQLLRTSAFSILQGCESVLAVGPIAADNPVDLAVRERRSVSDGPAEENVRIICGGMLGLTDLKQRVLRNYRQAGNTHWGDQTDVKAMCAQLNIGVFMFCDVPMALAAARLVCITLEWRGAISRTG